MNAFLRKLSVKFVCAFTCLLGRNFRRRFKSIVSEALGLVDASIEVVHVDSKEVRLVCLNDVSRWRASVFYDKEPETIEWIDGFAAGDVLWDIGANVGHYSIYAGARGHQVLSFEPSAANYYVLNASLEKSQLSNTVKAFCLAFSDVSETGDLNMQTTDFGGALSSFNSEVGFDGRKIDTVYRQGMIGYSIDDFVARFTPTFPNHIKIDVDGIEDKIIQGAPETLRDQRLKSISIELDDARPDYTAAIIAEIERAGFVQAYKKHAAVFDNGPYGSIYNFCFVRP